MKRKGFTLIELIIASAIFTVVLLSLYSAFSTGILSYNRIDSAQEVYQTAQIIFNRMEIDLKDAFVYLDTDSRFKGDNHSLDFFSLLDTFKDAHSLSGIYRVKYQLEDNNLKRFLAEGLEALKQTPEFTGEEFSSDVLDIALEYADTSGTSVNWQKAWPDNEDPNKSAAQLKLLPAAIKIKLSLIERNKREKEGLVVEFIKIVALFSAGNP